MPKLLKNRLERRTADMIANEQHTGFAKQDTAAVLESSVTAHCVRVVELGIRFPVGQLDGGWIGPAERSGGRGLIAAADADRVVGGRAAKPIMEAHIADVSVGSGIDEQFLVSLPDVEGDGVRGAVAIWVQP